MWQLFWRGCNLPVPWVQTNKPTNSTQKRVCYIYVSINYCMCLTLIYLEGSWQKYGVFDHIKAKLKKKKIEGRVQVKGKSIYIYLWKRETGYRQEWNAVLPPSHQYPLFCVILGMLSLFSPLHWHSFFPSSSLTLSYFLVFCYFPYTSLIYFCYGFSCTPCWVYISW